MSSRSDPRAFRVLQGVDAAIAWARRTHVRRAAAALALAYLTLRLVLLLMSDDPILGADAYTYWSAPYTNPYPGPDLGLPGAYLYPPPFIQALAPLRLLPWEMFHAVWAALGFAALVFLVGPVGGALAVTLLPFVFRDLLVGNIHLMLGAAIVIGLRHPTAWALPILTKLTPGIGVLWFAVRREWRRLAIAIGLSAAIALVSFLAAPGLWADWIERMTDDSGRAGGPYLAILVARVMIAAGIVLYAGWRDRAWLIPIALVVALPILWPDSLAILLACFPLIARYARRPVHRAQSPS
jgi:hypothetical protein